MNRSSDYSCPDCGSYLRTDPNRKPGKLYCHCGYERKTLQQLSKEIPPKPGYEEPVKFSKKKNR